MISLPQAPSKLEIDHSIRSSVRQKGKRKRKRTQLFKNEGIESCGRTKQTIIILVSARCIWMYCPLQYWRKDSRDHRSQQYSLGVSVDRGWQHVNTFKFEESLCLPPAMRWGGSEKTLIVLALCLPQRFVYCCLSHPKYYNSLLVFMQCCEMTGLKTNEDTIAGETGISNVPEAYI